MNADRALPRADPRAVVAEDDSDNSRNFVCLETSPMCRRDVLRVWLIVVAALRLLSVVIALLEPQQLAASLFAGAPPELTPLAARIFAAWTTTTCALCLLCAQERCQPDTPTFYATAFSFVVALALFLPELCYFGTMTPASVASPGIVASVSLALMSNVRYGWLRWRFDGALFKLSAIATLIVYARMLLGFHRQGYPGRLDTYLLWDEASASALLTELGPVGRSHYVEMYLSMLGDLTLPLCYAPALATLCWWYYPRGRLCILPPILAAACDECENGCILQLLVSYPDLTGWAVILGPIATVGKWALLGLTGLLLLALPSRRLAVFFAGGEKGDKAR